MKTKVQKRKEALARMASYTYENSKKSRNVPQVVGHHESLNAWLVSTLEHITHLEAFKD